MAVKAPWVEGLMEVINVGKLVPGRGIGKVERWKCSAQLSFGRMNVIVVQKHDFDSECIPLA